MGLVTNKHLPRPGNRPDWKVAGVPVPTSLIPSPLLHAGICGGGGGRTEGGPGVLGQRKKDPVFSDGRCSGKPVGTGAGAFIFPQERRNVQNHWHLSFLSDQG